MKHAIETFRERGIERGGLLFFRPKDAYEIIDELRMADIKVLGLDAFKITSTETQPFIEHSIDLSSANRDCWSLAQQFLIEKGNSGFVFEIIADE